MKPVSRTDAINLTNRAGDTGVVKPTAAQNNTIYQENASINTKTIDTSAVKSVNSSSLLNLLCIIQASFLLLFVVGMLYGRALPNDDAQGIGYLLLALVPSVVVISYINLFGLSIYIINKHPRGKLLLFYGISLAISSLIAGYNTFFMVPTLLLR